MDWDPFYFKFKNALFFIYCTEQNTNNEIISLRRCYLLKKHEEAFSNDMAVQCF